ncbi:MAG: bifunctional glutamate N-acetyltransferase/amino-acid acetyltransferase ArgJ [Cycloclasticus sp.]|nr:bifunctional glutamate N-acetyltransferase/amino-acid acetyltransferase ArgJ [Cycloclasticus sp.]MBQ0790542.1 bifunctional glutamate N-acetyltransferase/amino-acid acetyltransferase ArgJ [Cycloclasticus sp.]
MAVGKSTELHLKAISGIRIGTASAGIRQNVRDDIVLFELADTTRVAAVFTKNKFCAAPVTLARQHLADTRPNYLLVNSGNANAGLGTQGLLAAKQCCEGLAERVNSKTANILPFSTGVIGEPLPVNKVIDALQAAVDDLNAEHWAKAAKGIMTTDTRVKGCSRSLELDGETITLTGIAKGSGMIRPDMATMLSYVATDMPISQPVLQSMLNKAVNVSFNRITVDGDTSTNDALILMATGVVDTPEIKSEDESRYAEFLIVLSELCQYLAESIVRDGEGASKLIKVNVEGAASAEDAEKVAYTVAHSPLVKTAFFASDPNWGRILAAIGRAKAEQLNVDQVSIYLGDVCIVKAGMRASDYTEAQGQHVMQQDEITVRIDLAQGVCSTTVLTCDLSYDYVKINAEYRS